MALLDLSSHKLLLQQKLSINKGEKLVSSLYSTCYVSKIKNQDRKSDSKRVRLNFQKAHREN